MSSFGSAEQSVEEAHVTCQEAPLCDNDLRSGFSVRNPDAPARAHSAAVGQPSTPKGDFPADA
ncbi:MAG: hypothetical protein IPM64_14110 [Phycisphaerales bacterium]|nr:hypothetical protein [Phycisphaerales bacterium]